MVVPRYGPAVVGGAENLIRGLASRAVDPDDSIDVATTCALDHETWEDVLPPGESRDGNVRVLRFPVGERDAERHHHLVARLSATGRLSYAEEIDLMATSVWSSELQGFIERQGDQYDLVLFAPYLFGTTYWGAQAWPERSVLVPCLHDEPYARMRCIREMIESVAGCLFNSHAEGRLARRLYRVRGGAVVGLGFDPPSASPPPDFASSHGLGRYLVYAGRLEEGKGVGVAVEYVARYATEQAPDLRLVLLGRGSFQVPREYRWSTVELGFVDEITKRRALAEAIALVNPSRLESLSIVLMEAWLEGTPALVSANSEVLREHCELSRGGHCFADYEDFSAKLAALLEDPGEAARRGEAGRTYVLDTYGWGVVTQRFQDAVWRLATDVATASR